MTNGDADPALIGIDWGTSSFRAYLIGAQGTVLDRVVTGDGILRTPEETFDAVFHRCVGPWLNDRALPVLASGMITSRNGWLETPYIATPATASDLAGALAELTTDRGVRVRFVTGVITAQDTAPDVMRGEETQIIGAASAGLAGGMAVLPGTHSKWVQTSDRGISAFRTFMTGEVFAALSAHTILGALMEDGPFDPAGFDMGVGAGLQASSGLLHSLFQARTLPLTGKIGGEMVVDYLSGLLIGAEVSGAMAGLAAPGPVTIIGRSDLADRYARALDLAGVAARRAPADIVAQGHLSIARAAGLVR
jgi:2-dehydro-3-deoxygalactonokinase